MKGFVLGGTASSVGKTVATLATIRALQDAGHDVQPAKAGPDFIDPSHHAAVAGRPSRTLDTWMQGTDGVRRNYHRGEGDVCVVEGVMGLYDGDVSSTAAVAEALDLPVVLVVDGSAGMESVAATAHGFRTYAAQIGLDIDVVGIIAQRTHGGRHTSGIEDALPAEIEFLGRIGPDDRLEIPERHLGLHMGEEAPLPEDALADAAATLDVERLRRVAAEAASAPDSLAHESTGKTVAVAQDSAYRFVYPATMERLRERATVEPFSPVTGDSLPRADAIYLPGGYPELHAADLAESGTLQEMADAAADGVSVLGECGGMMTLSESLTTADGECHEMAGVLPAAVEMRDRYQALDHVELDAIRESPVAPVGATHRGHEFHYSNAEVDGDARFAFDVLRGDGIADGQDGLLEYDALGTYAHVHAASGAFDRLLERAQ